VENCYTGRTSPSQLSFPTLHPSVYPTTRNQQQTILLKQSNHPYTERERLIRPTGKTYSLHFTETRITSHSPALTRTTVVRERTRLIYHHPTTLTWNFPNPIIRDLPSNVTGTTGNQATDTKKYRLKVDLNL